jgi:hypothetical protein
LRNTTAAWALEQIAVISDVHGNVTALEAVLAGVQRPRAVRWPGFAAALPG